MMKFLILTTLFFASNAFATEAIFSCKKTSALKATILSIDTGAAQLGNEFLFRDNSYVPGKNGKFYYRYTNEVMDVLVPKVLATNRVNQGVIVTYSADGKILFSCLK